jgi:site-specific DNA-adenine methylase
MEVINDVNGDLITFYRCVRFHQDPLLTELEFVLNSRQELTNSKHGPKTYRELIIAPAGSRRSSASSAAG